MASKRKVRRRVAKALKKYVRGNPEKVFKQRRAAESFRDRQKRKGYFASVLEEPVDSQASTRRKRAQRRYIVRYEAGSTLINPPRVKGRKTKGGRAVTLRNFTGTIVKKSDGTVQIVGRGRGK